MLWVPSCVYACVKKRRSRPVADGFEFASSTFSFVYCSGWVWPRRSVAAAAAWRAPPSWLLALALWCSWTSVGGEAQGDASGEYDNQPATRNAGLLQRIIQSSHKPSACQTRPRNLSTQTANSANNRSPLQHWCSLLHSSQTGWFPSARQTSARQSSRPPWSWGRRFCFPLKIENISTQLLQAARKRSRCSLDSRRASVFR